MSTRCRIAIKEENGTYRSIYCHNDGYPNYVGEILEIYYTDINKIEKLMDLGDLSSLGASLEFKNPADLFKDPKAYVLNNGTTDYNRWRDEGTRAEVSNTIEELVSLAESNAAEFLYVFENGKWNIERINLRKLIKY